MKKIIFLVLISLLVCAPVFAYEYRINPLSKKLEIDSGFAKSGTSATATGSDMRMTLDDVFIDGNDNASPGVMRLGGTGNTNNEALDWDFETTANVVRVSSPTGVNTFLYGMSYASAKVTDTVATGAVTCDFTSGNVHYVDLPSGATTVTLSNPVDGGRYMVILKQPTGGADATVTWPVAVLWPSGVAPVLTTTDDYIDVITFVYDGTASKYYGSASQNYVGA